MLADSVSDSDSESRNKNKEIFPVNRLTQSEPTCRRLPPLYAPALLNKGHYLRRLAPTLGIGVGTCICLHYTRTHTPYGRHTEYENTRTCNGVMLKGEMTG